MSLPISYREYTTSKIVGGMLIFLALWVPLVACYCGNDSADVRLFLTA